MKKSFLLFLILFMNFSAKALEQNTYEFQPLKIVDKIGQNDLKSIKGLDKVNEIYFFATEYSKKKGLFLIEKKRNYWIVYEYNDFVSNYVVRKHNYLNNNYISIVVGAQRSGIGINSYSWYLIFDLKKKAYLILNKSSYNADENDKVLRKCESSIKFKNNIFTIKRTCFPGNECEYCIENGIYKIINGKFVKK